MKIYGYYDRHDQPVEEPTINPPLNGPCLYCGEPLRTDDMRTHSIMKADGLERSYFFRTHRTCDERAGSAMRNQICDVVWDLIQYHND